METKLDIENMTIVEYMKYEAEIKRRSRWNDRYSSRPKGYEYESFNSSHRDESVSFPHYFNDAKIDAYYDLPPLLPCFQPVQPRTNSGYESPYEDIGGDTDSIAEYESEEGEQELNEHTDQPLMNGSKQKSKRVSFVVDDILEEDIPPEVLPCQLPSKELNPGNFTLPCTIVLNEWVLDSFNIEADYGRTRDDPYSRRFDEYKKAFNNEVEQLANEYDLRIGKKGYALDEVWGKCEKFHGVHYTHGTMKDSKKKNDGRVV
ncbi:hypothetical protein Tco_0328082 [Tanacetum coccineum]